MFDIERAAKKQKNDETEMELSDEALRDIEQARKEKGGIPIDELAVKKVGTTKLHEVSRDEY